ncbi:hypothetical protein AVEN_223876-1 [Araneus ventricosus]|uniref:Uncharacterized protein n=1 Tax=Araneus ventricosus TaxID=182803 RepID=A0A4Y2QJC4_ARAVE|nr:hypothetical protein AVEN_223876-1 [Araneus ventricosus]
MRKKAPDNPLFCHDQKSVCLATVSSVNLHAHESTLGLIDEDKETPCKEQSDKRIPISALSRSRRAKVAGPSRISSDECLQHGGTQSYFVRRHRLQPISR